MKRSMALAALIGSILLFGSSPAGAVGDSFGCGDTTTITLNGVKTLKMWRTVDANGPWLNVSVPDSLSGRCSMRDINEVAVLTGDIIPDNDSQTVVVDLSGGAFGPGKTREGSGTSEIEITVGLGNGPQDRVVIQGSSAADTLRAGAEGIALNADGDMDLKFGGVEIVTLKGVGGADRLGANGGYGTGSRWTGIATIDGGSGKDTIVGGGGVDQLFGGAGDDTIDARDGKRDSVYGDAGYDRARLDSNDRRSSIEKRL